jgi:hypothetical protein
MVSGTAFLFIAANVENSLFCRIPRVRWSSSSRRGSPTPARRVGRTSALICSRRSWPLPRRAARPRPRRRRGHPGRRRDRHGGPAAPGLPRRRAGPAPAVRAAAHAATARSLAACAAIPAWVTLRPGGPASSPGYRAPAASLALMVPAPACSQRAEVRRPVSSRRASERDIYARGGILTGAILALPAIVVEHSLLFW